MNGLELARRYWREVGAPAMEAACPALRGRLAAGLVGEGSECLGYDDALSRDHDWGPGFCLWLTQEDFDAHGAALQGAYNALPREFLGFLRLRESPHSQGRVGVFPIGGFYRRFLGREDPPKTLLQWLAASDQALSVCTSGAVFEDGPGEFTQIRERLLAHYPEDVRRKRLAARCAKAAQSGQYNHPRCLSREDRTAALLALGEFVDHIQAAVFLLNRRYRPYYKWANRALLDLPLLGREAGTALEELARCPRAERQDRIEALSALLIRALGDQGLTDSASDFLLDHGERIQQTIQDRTLRSLPLLLGE